MNRIRQLRKERGLSMAKLAEAIGVSYQSLWKYEVGKRNPPITALIALADYLDTTVDYLISREPKNKIIKTYRYYIFGDDDYVLRDLGEFSPISGFPVPVLDENEFETLKYYLESNDNLSDILFDLCELCYEDEISHGSYQKLAEILFSKRHFLVEVIERVDS